MYILMLQAKLLSELLDEDEESEPSSSSSSSSSGTDDRAALDPMLFLEGKVANW